MHVHALRVVNTARPSQICFIRASKIGVLAQEKKTEKKRDRGRGNLTLMSLPNFHLETVLESLAVIHLTFNCWRWRRNMIGIGGAEAV